MSAGRRDLAQWLRKSHTRACDFALTLGVSRAYVSQILSGVRRPGLDMLVKIFDLTGIPPRVWVEKLESGMSTLGNEQKHSAHKPFSSIQLTGLDAS